MAKIRIEVDKGTVGRILKGQGEFSAVTALLQQRAQAIANAAGEGMEVSLEVGARRARAKVRTATFEAILAEATDRTLSDALDAGRG